MSRSASALISATTGAILSSLPVALMGAVAFLMREDIAFERSHLGAFIAVFFIASGVTSVPGGHLAEHFGAKRMLRVGACGSATALFCIGAFAQRPSHVVALLALAGFSHGGGIPAGNVTLMEFVKPTSQGAAYGFKQAAIPAATLLAGGAIPLLALRFGWRSAFMSAALLSLVVLFFTKGAPGRSKRQSGTSAFVGTRQTRGQLLLLGASIAAGSAAGNGMAAYTVESLLAYGVAPGTAGMVLVAGSVAGLLARALAGRAADIDRVDEVKLIAVMLVFGACGFLMMATGIHGVLTVGGVILGFGGGWGWAGVFNLTVIRRNTAAPGVATGIATTGVFAGAVAGPLLFGLAAEAWSFNMAWVGAAGFALLACVAFVSVMAKGPPLAESFPTAPGQELP